MSGLRTIRTPEERLVSEVRRYRESLAAVVVEAKAMHLGTCLHVAERSLELNFVKDIINAQEGTTS